MVLCEGTTRAGAQCKNKAKYDGRWCHHHQHGSRSAPRPPVFPTAAKCWPKSPKPTVGPMFLHASTACRFLMVAALTLQWQNSRRTRAARLFWTPTMTRLSIQVQCP
ncbi:hypothetical protein BC567DRAFT_237959 [Phyllosticta citribraziliensis]